MLTALVFRLWAPMASWGDIAVGERRGSWSRPGKTAVLGLVAAALGYRRENEAEHRALHDGLGYAVRVDITGRPMRDYQTAESPSARRNARWGTRRDELANKDVLNTILSERSYYTEPSMTVALWRRGPATAPDFSAIEDALRAPRFVLYLGRKACPLGCALWPLVLEADSLAAAFVLYGERRPRLGRAFEGPADGNAEIWADVDPELELAQPEIVRRRDGLRDRRRWLFADRLEGRLAAPDAAGSA